MDEYLKEIISLLKATKEEKAVLTIDEVINYTQIGRSRIFEIINSKETDFPYFRNGKKILVNKILLDKWLEDKAKKHEIV